MLLSDNKELFQNLIKEISNTTGIRENYIEKDFYAITILKELVSRNEKFVFKGGTSLSVCQKIINRFSEDIDISYMDEIITTGTRKAIKKIFFASIEAASLQVSNADNIRSRRIFNRYLCPYSSLWNMNGDQIIVEWATQTPSFPIEEKEAQTMIGKYLTQIGRNDLIEQYNLEPFIVKTITKERTLVDKIFAICDYHISRNLNRESRHVYDISRLIQYVKLDDNLISLFLKVKEYRLKLEKCYSVQIDRPLSSILYELIEQDTFLQDYNEKTYPLLYDGVTYLDCIPSIKAVADFLKSNNL